MSHDANRLAGLTRQEKLALLARLAREQTCQPQTFPVSFSQQRFWFLDRLDPGSHAQNIFRAWSLGGRLDAAALDRAVGEIARRHASLRTTFREIDGEPQQVVAPALAEPEQNLALTVTDLRDQPAPKRRVEEIAAAESQHPFDLTRGPLIRVTLLRTGDQEHVLLLVLHHIVADGWSVGILLDELHALYRSFHTGEPAPLRELPIQYSDFARWQREKLPLDAQLEYWRRELARAPGVLELPADRVRAAVESLSGGHHFFTLPVALSQALRELGLGAGATPFMTLLAAFDALLYRWTGQSDLLVGTPIANRHRTEVEGLIGCFANTLVLRADLSGDPSFRELLGQVRRRALGAYVHQDLPFEKLVEELQPERDLSRNPLFQVMFALQNAPPEEFTLAGLELERMHFGRDLSKVDLTLEMVPAETGLQGYFEYSKDLFDAVTVARMTGHLRVLLEGIVADPERALGELPLVTPGERHQLQVEWNDTAGRDRPDDLIHRLFAQRAQAAPEAEAVASGRGRLTFAQLDRRANRLARSLQRLGVGLETRVGICMERSPEAVVAILGVLKAGGAYVPLDPAYPRERLAWVIEDAGIRVVLTQEPLRERLGEKGPRSIFLDRDWEKVCGDSEAEEPPSAAGPQNAAYVIYTSGSTGRPKGVVVPHRAMVNHALAIVRHYGLEAGDRVLQFASLSFDISIEELFPSWLSGATVVLRSPELSLAFADFLRFVAAAGITVANLPTPYWHELTSELAAGRVELPPRLRLLIVGTEQALPERLETWLRTPAAGRPRWINAYGPSEATITATTWEPATPEIRHVPIGRPIANVQVRVLDRRGRPVPVGVPGELCLGGAGLARGYLDRPGLSAEKFLPDPFSGEPGRRLYATGDVARTLAAGEVEFLGRIDQQVKVRGFRIEVGEIEATLASHAAIKEAVVVAAEVAPGDRRLVAYAVPEELPSPAGERRLAAEIRGFLHETLPQYMVPAAFVVLPGLPLTPSGKVDRRALPAPDWTSAAGAAEFAAPRTPQQEAVAAIWAEVLELPRVGINDSFFELGGHSLLATRILSRIRQLLEVELPLRALFETPTIAGLSAAIERIRRRQQGLMAPPIEPRPRQGEIPLSFAQQRLWFLDQLEPGAPAYNMPAALRLRGDLDAAVLWRAVDEVVRRHQSLRTTFRSVRGRALQEIAPRLELALPRVDLAAADPAAAEGLAREESLRPFDLAAGPLLRTLLLRLDEGEHWLVFTFHHIISDGWSTDVFIRELLTLYAAFVEGRPSPLPELRVQYADFAHWQRGWLRGEVLDAQIGYWRERLAGAPALLELPADRPRPLVQRFRGARQRVTLTPELTAELRSLSRRRGVTLFMTFLAAFDVLLYRYSGQSDILVGTPISGRNQAEIEGLIGFFVNTLVLRGDLSGEPGFAELLGRIRESALGAYAHQDLPFEQLVEELQPERHLEHNPLFQVLLVLHQATGIGYPELPGLEPSLPSIDNRTSRFDLTFSLAEYEDRFAGFLEYNTDLYDATTVRRMTEHFAILLAGALTDPRCALTQLPLLDAAARHQLVAEWNDTQTAARPERCLHELIEAQVERTPEAPALVFEGEELSYRELDRRANQLARHLRSLGVAPEVRVGICAERSLELVVGLLGILKAGGAYVPLDPTYPSQRLSFMAQAAGVRVLLTQERLRATLPELAERICLDRDQPAISAQPTGRPDTATASDHLAYLIFTSGSTGQPKGSMVSHRAIVNRLLWMQEAYGLRAGEGVLQKTPFSFDVSVWEFFWPLIVGARLVLARPGGHQDGAYLAQVVAEQEVTTLHFVPSMLQVFLEQPRLEGCDPRTGGPVRRVIASGEALSYGLQERFFARLGAELHNLYGPTEAAVDVTCWACERESERCSVPIGHPIANICIHLLDRGLRPVPPPVAGELHIGGVGLARGYVGRPDLTAERFVPDPFSREPGDRLYKTGDLARYGADAGIEYLGRIDFQVKVRGFRIELGEIEAAMDRHPAVRECVVVARQDTGDQRLVAYAVAGSELPAREEEGERQAAESRLSVELRGFLKEKVPEYMVPAVVVFPDALPLTPNGKVDRKALPAPEWGRSALEAPFEAPRNRVEEQLAEIWTAVLGIGKIGIHDNFFDLGGHSLLATQVTARIAETFRVELPLRSLFETPTIAALAEEVIRWEVEQADEELLARLMAELDDTPAP